MLKSGTNIQCLVAISHDCRRCDRKNKQSPPQQCAAGAIKTTAASPRPNHVPAIHSNDVNGSFESIFICCRIPPSTLSRKSLLQKFRQEREPTRESGGAGQGGLPQEQLPGINHPTNVCCIPLTRCPSPLLPVCVRVRASPSQRCSGRSLRS